MNVIDVVTLAYGILNGVFIIYEHTFIGKYKGPPYKERLQLARYEMAFQILVYILSSLYIHFFYGKGSAFWQ